MPATCQKAIQNQAASFGCTIGASDTAGHNFVTQVTFTDQARQSKLEFARCFYDHSIAKFDCKSDAQDNREERARSDASDDRYARAESARLEAERVAREIQAEKEAKERLRAEL